MGNRDAGASEGRKKAEAPRRRRRRRSRRSHYDLVVLTTASEGVTAAGSILEDIPARFPAAFAVAQHRSSHQSSVLAAVLGLRTPLKVKVAEDGEVLRNATVYLAPQDAYIMLNPDLTLGVVPERRARAPCAALPLVESAAAVLGDRLLVILAGDAPDPLDVMRAAHGNGSFVILEDCTGEATHPAPDAEQAAKEADMLLPLHDVGPTLIALVRKDPPGS